MAVSTIAFVDTTAQPDAVTYYKMFPNEPLPGGGELMVSKIIPVNRTAEKLLEQIAAHVKPGGNALVAGHGNDTGTLFSIGDSRNRVQLETDVLWAIRYDLEGKAREADTAATLKLSLLAWRKFKTLIQKVQKLGLDRVDLRACKVGADKDLVPLFAQQAFFGCNTACAPAIYDAFGKVELSLTSDPKVWAQWIKDHPGVTMTGASGGRIAVGAEWHPGFKVSMIAESQDAVSDWVSAHLPSNGTTYSSGQPFFHGLTQLGKLPIFAGEPDFPKYLREALKGREPSRKIDVRAMPAIP